MEKLTTNEKALRHGQTGYNKFKLEKTRQRIDCRQDESMEGGATHVKNNSNCQSKVTHFEAPRSKVSSVKHCKVT